MAKYIIELTYEGSKMNYKYTDLKEALTQYEELANLNTGDYNPLFTTLTLSEENERK